jgi:hypothetical protein
MELARQSTSKAATGRRTPKKSARAATIAAIHITWSKLRRDLKGDKEELRESRLLFMSQVLNREVTTSRGLSQAKLGKVLDAMRALESSPLLPGGVPTVEQPPAIESAPAEVHHLATEAQVATSDKLFGYLGWSPEAIASFTEKRFKRKSPRLITPKQANSLTMILMNIAASRDIKRRWKAERGREVEHVSREMIRAEIPALKRRLGIDQKVENQEDNDD